MVRAKGIIQKSLIHSIPQLLTTNFSLLHTEHSCTQTQNCVTQFKTIVSFLPFSRPIDSTSSGMYIRPGIHRPIGDSVVVAQSLPMWVWRFSLSVKALFHQSQCVSVLRTFVLSHVFSWPLCLILSITDIPQKSHWCCWWPVYYILWWVSCFLTLLIPS